MMSNSHVHSFHFSQYLQEMADHIPPLRQLVQTGQPVDENTQNGYHSLPPQHQHEKRDVLRIFDYGRYRGFAKKIVLE